MSKVVQKWLRGGADTYHCQRIDSTEFRLDGNYFPVGSWVVKPDKQQYAYAMSAEDFDAWSKTLRGVELDDVA